MDYGPRCTVLPRILKNRESLNIDMLHWTRKSRELISTLLRAGAGMLSEKEKQCQQRASNLKKKRGNNSSNNSSSSS